MTLYKPTKGQPDWDIVLNDALDNLDGRVTSLQDQYDGVQTIQGTTGSTGPRGAQGYNGAQGFAGLQGIQGLRGPQGTQGLLGVQGARGVQGTVGAQGIQGLIGEGTQGLQGLQGSNIQPVAQSVFSFETNIYPVPLDGWVFAPSGGDWDGADSPTLSVSTDFAHNGTKSLHIQWSSGTKNQVWFSVDRLTKLIGPLSSVTMSGWIYVPTGSPDVELNTGDGQYAATYTDYVSPKVTVTAKDVWTFVTLTMTLAEFQYLSTVSGDAVNIEPVWPGGVGSVYVDNFTITANLEPSSPLNTSLLKGTQGIQGISGASMNPGTPGVAGVLKGATNGNNTVLGEQALIGLYTGAWNNTAVGLSAGTALTSGGQNTLIGNQALLTASSTNSTTAVGQGALYFATSGDSNTAIGTQAGLYSTTGEQNVIIGAFAGTAGDYSGPGVTHLTTGSNNVIIGYNNSPSASDVSNEITLGNSSITSLRAAVTSITSLSDARDKKDVVDLPVGLDFINNLKPVKFTWDTRDGAKVDVPEAGFIAQDLLATEELFGTKDWTKIVMDNNPEKLEAAPGKLIPILVKAIQELSARLVELENKPNGGTTL